MTPPAADSAILERLRAAVGGEYEIVRELGRGGFATVYLGRHVALEREVAIKVLTMLSGADSSDGAADIERFRREAKTAGRLSHPHIIPIYSVGEADGLNYFVMKFVKGRPLDAVLKASGALPLPLVQTILTQAGGALAHAHRHGVVHRDIKPANIMLDEDGWAVVADFGIAKVAQAEKLTATGMIIGTAAYMSPEQWAGHDVTGRSDEYSLGIVAYELLTGTTPFEGNTVPALLWAHLNEIPPPITDRRPDCPPELERIVRRMLEKEPNDRWPSLEDVVDAIGTLPLLEAPEQVRTKLISLATASMPAGPAASRTPSVASAPLMPSTKVARLAVSPAEASVQAGASLRLQVRTMNTTGQSLAGRVVAWHSQDPSVATVDADGVVTARGPGRTTVTATCEGADVAVPVTVSGSVLRRHRQAVRAVVATVGVTLITLALLFRQGVFDAAIDVADFSTRVARRAVGIVRPPLASNGGAASPAGAPMPIDPRTVALGPGSRDKPGVLIASSATPLLGAPVPLPKDTGSKAPIPPIQAVGSGGAVEGRGGTPANAGGSAPPTSPPTPEGAKPATSVVDVSAGGTATCAALSNGADVLCWGGESPTGALVSGFYFSKLAVGGGHICGLTPDGVASCWGDNAQGQLGDGSTAARATPTEVKATVRFTGISVGAAHTCALGADGSAWCWGSNKYGQLGDNSLGTRTRPVLVRGREAFQALSAGGSHTCGVARGGKAYCWGDGFSGQIGNAMQEIQREPFPIKAEVTFRTIVTGERHTCGLSSSGRAYCWGENTKGQLGNDTRDDRNVPDSVATDLIFTQLSAGAGHTCGITNARSLACWGENGSGQLGDGTRGRREAPVVVSKGTTWKQVSAGAAHTCGISRTDAVLCWGANTRGQIGSGTAGAISPVPAVIKVGARAS